MRSSSSQQKSGVSCLQSFLFKCYSQLLTDQSKPLLVFWRTASCSRVFPIKVQTVKAMRPQICYGGCDKLESFLFGGNLQNVNKNKCQILAAPCGRLNLEFTTLNCSFNNCCNISNARQTF